MKIYLKIIQDGAILHFSDHTSYHSAYETADKWIEENPDADKQWVEIKLQRIY